MHLVVTVLFAAQLFSAQSGPPLPATVTEPQDFQWKPALLQSLQFLMIQHAGRMIQEKTRRELDGPFFKDYIDAASNIHTWSDGDGILTNYVGHPIMGATAGYIQIFNDPRGRPLEFDGRSRNYWNSRLKALAWSAAYSTLFEIGPLSEASIGNVGKVPPTMAVVDLVITPVGGFGLILLEDWVDKRFIASWEQSGGFKARFLRIALNPSRSLGNALRWKSPSYRDTRARP